jgi:glyoxylase-like metal-dependent hydrolase (beta-lactamase superfamily II)
VASDPTKVFSLKKGSRPMPTPFAAALGVLALAAAQTGSTQQKELLLWRLDCGTLDGQDLGLYSDTGLYAGQKRKFADSCYLIRNGDRYLLWDTGVDVSIAGKGQDPDGNRLDQTIVAQLAEVEVQPADIDFVGISHFHQDHTGQVANFPSATLLIGAPDWQFVKEWAPAAGRFAHWIGGAGKVEPLKRDKDVFGDGLVTILRMPGHTDGHQALLVRLASGPVLLTGDQYHFTENRKARGVPAFNSDRAATLASHDRLETLATNLKAKVIIQHEPADIDKLPDFPRPAR